MANLPQAYDIFKEYWKSKDFDESYFSLYYTIHLAAIDHYDPKLLHAIIAASFSLDRKIEMLKLLNFTNDELIAKLSATTDHHSKMLFLSALAPNELNYEQFTIVIKEIGNDENLIYQSLAAFIGIKQIYSYHYLAELIDKGNAKINALMAKLLTDNKDAYSFTLLKKLFTSTNWTVRYNSAVSILAYQKYGQQFLQLIQQQTNDNTSRSMADLRLRINAVEKGTLC